MKITGNASLNALDLESSILYWTNSGVWDPVKKQVRWIGGPGTCCSSLPTFKMITYDEATDTWAITPTPYTGSGHGYDGNAINPATGLHYFGQKDEPQVRVWDGASFSLLPAAPVSALTTPSLTWFPELNSGAGGLLFMGDEGKLAWYNGSQWTSITGVQTTGYDNFSEYNPVDKVVWLGNGSGAYRLSADLTLTRLAAAPFSLEGNACALHSCDPLSGLYIVTNLANNTWWTFDIMTDTWAQIAGQAGKPEFGTSCNGSGNNQFQVPISDYGVILYVDHGTSPLSVYLYKPSAPVSQVRMSPPRKRRYAVGNPLDPGTGNLAGIYDLRGRKAYAIKAPPKAKPSP
ncbi:MAG: hypothetical protein JF616_15230 [Fibrobacteres bacterium]|nr:hypothetical protein [Fibrobacterota bacterium]